MKKYTSLNPKVHTWNSKHGYIFEYDGYLSESCSVTIYSKYKPEEKCTVYSSDIIDFVADYIRNRKLDKLKNAETDEILGIQ